MHFEILVEDQSGEKMLDLLVPKILGKAHTVKVHSYKGIGHIPTNMQGKSDPNKRILLDQLPRLLRGYGKTSFGCPVAVIVVCDLDNKCQKIFRKELFAVLNGCNPALKTRFCFAVEEGEAWFLGDVDAIINAYPKAKKAVMKGYVNDSICGTWEKLADVICSGGVAKLKTIGMEKFQWAENITPHMDVDNNKSPSFVYFRDTLRKLAKEAPLKK